LASGQMFSWYRSAIHSITPFDPNAASQRLAANFCGSFPTEYPCCLRQSNTILSAGATG
jgi:hypothetical protein